MTDSARLCETVREHYDHTGKMRKRKRSDLTMVSAYGRVWVGCEHGGQPGGGVLALCRDCFRAAIEADDHS